MKWNMVGAIIFIIIIFVLSTISIISVYNPCFFEDSVACMQKKGKELCNSMHYEQVKVIDENTIRCLNSDYTELKLNI